MTSRQVLPQVRYHPSIQMPGPAREDLSRSDQRGPARPRPRSTSDPGPVSLCGFGGPGTNPPLRLPKVRYHPSIQTPDERTHGAAAGPQRVVAPHPRSSSHPGPETRCGPQLLDLSLNTGSVLPDTKLDVDEVDRVEVLTRGQRSNPAWFSWRTNRITASKAHRIANCGFVKGTSETPPHSYLDEITAVRPSRPTSAMKWGTDHEDEAVRRYQELRPAVTVQACGLFLDRHRPWLAGSPDGIVMDRRSGARLRCLEVKCPYKHRDQRVKDACGDPDFCLEMDPERAGEFRLKRKHSYFTQVQCQMAVTGLTSADFVVYTLNDLVIVPVTFDPDFWAQTVSRLEKFSRDALLPHLRREALQAPEV